MLAGLVAGRQRAHSSGLTDLREILSCHLLGRAEKTEKK